MQTGYVGRLDFKYRSHYWVLKILGIEKRGGRASSAKGKKKGRWKKLRSKSKGWPLAKNSLLTCNILLECI